MQINLKQLQEIGALVPVEPVKSSVKWKHKDADGKMQDYSGDVFVRRNACSTLERDIDAMREGLDKFATKIASTVCDEKGAPIFTYDEAMRLNEPLTMALLEAISNANGGGEKKSKRSMKSGTNSPAPSAAPSAS